MSFHISSDINSFAAELSREVSRSTENAIMEQLNDFISRDLIEVQIQGHTFARDPYSTKIEVRQSVKLVLKDKEYIERLENENEKLKEKLANLALIFEGTK